MTRAPRLLKTRLGSGPDALEAARTFSGSQRGGSAALDALKQDGEQAQSNDESTCNPAAATTQELPRSLLSSEIHPDQGTARASKQR